MESFATCEQLQHHSVLFVSTRQFLKQYHSKVFVSIFLKRLSHMRVILSLPLGVKGVRAVFNSSVVKPNQSNCYNQSPKEQKQNEPITKQTQVLGVKHS